ncbi:hypothetical protein [Ensifer aridi]|uniref:hypothetical protein n=1 Tax=Ensifer aridi TaxID=1708715 RepID=UPI00111C4B54|nr:hypothetical protein [Ensifer aridi]
MLHKYTATAFFILLSAFQTTAQEAFERTVTWSANDGGVVECPVEFGALGLGKCLPGGIDALGTLNQGRACAMTIAIELAKNNHCQPAFAITKATQCHNASEQNVLMQAGVMKVCELLQRF